jgi:hypothetical protein
MRHSPPTQSPISSLHQLPSDMGLFRRKHHKSATPLEGTSRDLPRDDEPSDSDPHKADPYAALRDIDVFNQKSEDGLNRTNDPSRGPIE